MTLDHSNPTLQADMKRVRHLAKMLDARFSIAGVQFGFDAILGLIPVAGDTITALLGIYPLYIARKHGLGKFVQSRMIGNLLLDWGIGAIPLVGDIFDIGFKSHVRNLKLLEERIRKEGSAMP
jgi:hypothetical protein